MGESRAWFRLYTEFAFDPKVQLLDETLQRRYVMLLCAAAGGMSPFHAVSEAAFLLRITVSECEETRSALVSRGLITDDWFPVAWDKRQFESDTSTARVKRFRQRQKTVTKGVTGTPSEQSRAEHTQNRAEQSRRARGARLPPDWQLTPERRQIAESENLDAERTFSKFTSYWQAASGRTASKRNWDAAWNYWCREERDRKPKNGHGAHAPSPYPKSAIELTNEALEQAVLAGKSDSQILAELGEQGVDAAWIQTKREECGRVQH